MLILGEILMAGWGEDRRSRHDHVSVTPCSHKRTLPTRYLSTSWSRAKKKVSLGGRHAIRKKSYPYQYCTMYSNCVWHCHAHMVGIGQCSHIRQQPIPIYSTWWLKSSCLYLKLKPMFTICDHNQWFFLHVCLRRAVKTNGMVGMVSIFLYMIHFGPIFCVCIKD